MTATSTTLSPQAAAQDRYQPPASASSPSSPWIPKFASSKAQRVRQILYLTVMHGLGAALISGGINFGVSVAMYLRQSDITMWILAKNTVAGDMGVTVLIQVTVTFIITSTLIRGDLKSGLAIPLQQPWPPAPASTAQAEGSANLSPATPYTQSQHRSPLQLLKHNVETFYIITQQNFITQGGISVKERFWRLFRTALQGFILACCVFPWFWGIAIAILAPIYSNKQLGHTWVPMVIKGVYGALLGLITNPLIALMNLGAHDVAGQDLVHRKGATPEEERGEALPAKDKISGETTAVAAQSVEAPEPSPVDTSVSQSTVTETREQQPAPVGIAAAQSPPEATARRSEEMDAVSRPRTSFAISASDSRMTLDRESSNAHEDFESAVDVPLSSTTDLPASSQ
ncbi:hypothetical protein OC861_005993 [Tilletia horrida]|nr:hypothetical protein OC845_002192 [Tilletia horrida]KAK0561073.1 hypothetical protein OC861_005993 [Tilletia horrida]